MIEIFNSLENLLHLVTPADWTLWQQLVAIGSIFGVIVWGCKTWF